MEVDTDPVSNNPTGSTGSSDLMHKPVEAIPIYVEELLLLLTCYVEGTS